MFVIQSLLDKSSVLRLQGRFSQYSKYLFCLYWKISSYFQCELFWHSILAFVWLKGLPGIKNLPPDIDSHRLGSRHLLISSMIYSIDWGSKGFHCKTCFLSFLRFLMTWTTVRKVFFWKLIFHFFLNIWALELNTIMVSVTPKKVMPFYISVHYFFACAFKTCTTPFSCCFTLGAHLQ